MRPIGWVLSMALALAGHAAAAQGISENYPDGTAGFSSGWRICNETGFPMSVAYTIKEGNTWHTHGWRDLDVDACVTVLDKLNTRYVYYHAEDLFIEDWPSDRSMCVDKAETFTVTPTMGACAADQNALGFKEVDTASYPAFTTRLMP